MTAKRAQRAYNAGLLRYMGIAPDRWTLVERLYHAAVTRSMEEREAFLVEACAGDDVLHQEVESLLAQSDGSCGFLGAPAIAVAAAMASAPEASVLTGWRIGVYELRELLGAGGMGQVYRARDTKLGRDVAIKILPRIFTSDPERLARFEREARMLAALTIRTSARSTASRRPKVFERSCWSWWRGTRLPTACSKGPCPSRRH